MPIIIKSPECLISLTVDIRPELVEQIKRYCESNGIYDWGFFIEQAAILFIAHNK